MPEPRSGSRVPNRVPPGQATSPPLLHMVRSSEQQGSHLQALEALLGGSSCLELVFLHTAVETTEGAGRDHLPSCLPATLGAHRPAPGSTL